MRSDFSLKTKTNRDVSIKSYSDFKKKSEQSVGLPGLVFSHEKNMIFAITGTGVG